MEKRLLIAMALSLIILFSFQNMFKPSPAIKKTQTVEKLEGQNVTAEESTPLQSSQEETLEEQTIGKEEETIVQTNKYEIIFSNIGGSIKSIKLKEFKTNESGDDLFNAENITNRLGTIQSKQVKGITTGKYELSRGNDYIIYTYEKPGVIKIEKKYAFSDDEDYLMMTIKTENLSAKNINFQYSITGPSKMKEIGEVRGRHFVQANTIIDNSLVRKNSVKGIWEKQGEVDWIGEKNRYYAVVLKPLQNPVIASISGDNKQGLLTKLKITNGEIIAGGTKEDQYLLYAGPLIEQRLSAINENMNQLIDYGKFGIISKGILKILRFFYNIVHNWGLAIILLTILVNAATFPLTLKSFKSMSQMKKVQPHMQKLREIHKDNPQKLNKEMMELYKQYNVNPFGGCLPILLQIPIFFALYQGLIRSIELKGAHFLWVKDLSSPDALKLPFSLPLIGNHINVLPLLMVLAMLFQQVAMQGAQAAATEEQAQQQKMMMFLMPLMFGFFFYNMPSGLVLYWLTNTVLMSSEHAILGRQTA